MARNFMLIFLLANGQIQCMETYTNNNDISLSILPGTTSDTIDMDRLLKYIET